MAALFLVGSSLKFLLISMLIRPVRVESSLHGYCALSPLGRVNSGGRVGMQMIDEVHTLIGAGAAEGAIDAANILKPALARGELQCIGATTLDEYRKHIEKDPALER